MLRTAKKALSWLILLLMLFVRAGAEDTLFSDREINARVSGWKEVAVEAGDVEELRSSSVAEYAPQRNGIFYEGPSARFVEWLVEREATVTAGQILGTFSVEPDQAALLEIEQRVSRSRENREDRLETLQKTVEEKQQVLRKAGDRFAREQAQIALEMAQLQLKKADLESARELSRLEKQLEELREDAQPQHVVAPVSGVVTELYYFKNGESVSRGQKVAVISGMNVLQFAMNDDGGSLWYNMPVSFSVNNRTGTLEGSARVIACGRVDPNSVHSQKMILQVESLTGSLVDDLPEDLETRIMAAIKVIRRMPNVSWHPRSLYGVTVLPRSVMTLDGGLWYVYVPGPDGTASRRAISAVNYPGSKVNWVLQGLAPGDTVLVRK